MNEKLRQEAAQILNSLAGNCKSLKGGNDAALLMEAVAVAIECGNETALYQSFLQHFMADAMKPEDFNSMGLPEYGTMPELKPNKGEVLKPTEIPLQEKNGQIVVPSFEVAKTAFEAEKSVTCEHTNIDLNARICRIIDENGKFTHAVLEAFVLCGQCKEPFVFVGLPGGLSPSYPTASPDNRELRAPMKPENFPTQRDEPAPIFIPLNSDTEH